MHKVSQSLLLIVVLLIFGGFSFVVSANRLLREQHDGDDSVGTIQYVRYGETGKATLDLNSVYGPQICTDLGDPFSPWNSIYAPDSFTYKYRIRIPASYPLSIVRVELFDPDSINSAENFATVVRTSKVQDPSVVSPPLPATTTKTCGVDSTSATQDDSCTLPTDELDYLDAPLSMDQINPYWYQRVDSNRGQGDPSLHGNGNCGSTGSYEPGFNTQTRFELYYFRTDDALITRRSLASYTGQTGDNRDLNLGASSPGDHNTDLTWVSPGAENQGPDFDAEYGTNAVPVDPGSATTFEIDLTTDVPLLEADSDTGARDLYLDVTALSGASLNAFRVWAGPPDYVQSVPANINQRNVVVTNSPGEHNSQGVTVTAVNRAVFSSATNGLLEVERPLTFIPASFADVGFTLSLFDLDAGTVPPVTFFFDNIPESDWSLTFAQPGIDDPDGVPDGVRCAPGSCNAQWINPAYQLKLPGNLEACFEEEPKYGDCVPFYGGTLMMRYAAGEQDTFAIEIRSGHAPPVDRTKSCASYPVGLGASVRSVTPPGTGATPYPNDFEYPLEPPLYSDFPKNDPSRVLRDAHEGTLFLLQIGTDGHHFSWLRWNQLIESSPFNLANSMIQPGDTIDYTNHADSGTAHPGYGHVVRGYIEPGDLSDTVLQIDDSVAISPYQLPDAVDAVRSHIDRERALRLPVVTMNGDGTATVYRFGIFTLIGYGESGTASEWLLVEFEGWDTSCGQLQTEWLNYFPISVKP